MQDKLDTPNRLEAGNGQHALLACSLFLRKGKFKIKEVNGELSVLTKRNVGGDY